jgi:hypothetical protein
VGGACGTQGRGEESVQGIGVKARRTETTLKTKAEVGNRDPHRPSGAWPGGGGGGLDSTVSGQ